MERSKEVKVISSGADIAEEILKIRGFDKKSRDKFLHPDYDKHLHNPFLLNDMDKAVKRIKKAIREKEKIVIYGDYDIDGMSATALLLDGLSGFGLKPGYYIPDRFEEGYGLNERAIEKLKDEGVKLIITVDSGTSAADQISFAKQNGLDVIVTDHHNLSGDIAKDAVAIVNPKIKGYPFSELAGVGVAFKLICALQQELSNLAKGQEKWLLDLVALGSVCDSVSLTDENRVLVKFGLSVFRQTRRVGLRVLAKVANIDIAKVDTHKIGFIFGPRLNAAGRLAHAKLAMQLLICQSEQKALEIANELEKLNIVRKNETQRIYSAANSQVKIKNSGPILVLSDRSWSHGIVGIVASRLAEKYKKPVIILQDIQGIAKGSARSYGDFSIIEAIASAKDYLIKFGGHHYAAGLSLDVANIGDFTKAINKYANVKIDKSSQQDSLAAELSISDELICLSSYYQLSQLEPFGEDNSRPIFSTRLKLSRVRLVGQDKTHLAMDFIDKGNRRISAIAFGKAEEFDFLDEGKHYLVIYRLDENFYRGYKDIQIEVMDVRS